MAAPTATSMMDKYVLRDLKLEWTTLGYQAWRITLDVGLGPLLATTLNNALSSGNLEPRTDRERSLHLHIGRALTPSLTHLPETLVQMHKACAGLGPKSVRFIADRLDPASIATTVGKLVGIMSKPLDEADVVNSMSDKVAINRLTTR